MPKNLEREAAESLRTQHDAGIDLIERHLAGVSENVLVLARLPALAELAAAADSTAARREVERHFHIVVDEHPSYLQLRYLDAAGREVVRVNRDPAGVRVLSPVELQDKSRRYYVQAAARVPAGEVYVSPIDLNREQGVIERPYVPVVRFATRVRVAEGPPAGLVVVNVAAAGLLEALRGVPGGGTDGALLLMDEDGYFMLHADPQRSWSGPRDLDSGWNYFQQALDLRTRLAARQAGDDPTDGRRQYEPQAAGSQIVAGYVGPTDEGERWLLVTTAPRSAILAPASRLRLTLVAVFVAMAVAGVVVIWFAVGRLSRPARRLQEGAARMGSGDFEHRIDLSTGHELSDIAGAFNDMAEQLRDSYRTLEGRIAERTSDLRDRDEKLRALSEMGMALVEERSPEAVAERARAYARRLVGARSVDLALLDDEATLAAPPGEQHDNGPVVVVAKAASEAVAEAAAEADGAGDNLRVPLAARGRTVGELRVGGRSDGRPFTDTDRDLLETLASHVAVALVNARLHVRERATVTQLEELNQARLDFVSAVSHQLRSPVAAVRGYTDILSEHSGDLEPGQRDRILGEIAGQTRNLSELVEDVLRVSRIDSGRLEVVTRPCLLDPVIEEAARDAEPMPAPSSRIRLQRPQRPVVVSADPALLKQVFLNLMENALKYSPEGSPVEVAWRRDVGDHTAIASVRDRGPGIPPEARERVFERFVRLSLATGRPEVPGTGLGLYIARSIVRAHGSEIGVESGGEGGACIVMRLPTPGGEA